MSAHEIPAAHIERIREKLGQARQVWLAMAGVDFTDRSTDPRRWYPFFGARKHGFVLNPPLSLASVRSWEVTYRVTLPAEYETFLTQLGDGGAPAYYGILSLQSATERTGRGVDERRQWLTHPCVLREDLPQEGEAWLEEEAGPDWEARFNRDEWAPGFGTLPVVEEGCCLETVLVLNGPCRGRLCHLDWLHAPVFAPPPHFLVWYEAWLDDVLAVGKK